MTTTTLRDDARAAEKYGEWERAAEKWQTFASATTDKQARDEAELRARKCALRALRVPAP